ncbi:hypothetical protein EVAR_102562_1 [Eumeta japonica]|uniref:Uncharacterized protein n=1 Tax=Eumeta variegata TaxID=151549 RepID=A0A4C2A5D9_EUMVA|nr:hypothetical protein EVAR_102562_1 [Eumeta japonica]
MTNDFVILHSARPNILLVCFFLTDYELEPVQTIHTLELHQTTQLHVHFRVNLTPVKGVAFKQGSKFESTIGFNQVKLNRSLRISESSLSCRSRMLSWHSSQHETSGEGKT